MLVNEYGQVVGINSQKIASTEYEGMGFSIPMSVAKPIIDNLIKFGYIPDRAKLGIKYYTLNYSSTYSMIAQIKGLPAGSVIIANIDSDSSLYGTDAKVYDLICAVNGKELEKTDVLLEAIENGKPGDELTLSLVRINSDYSIKEFDVKVTLVEDTGAADTSSVTTESFVYPFN